AQDFSGNQTTATMEVNVTLGTATLPTNGGVARNKTPYMNNINDQYVLVGKARPYLLQAQDLDGDPITFTLLGAPGFVRLDTPDPVAGKATLLISPQQGDPTVTNNIRVLVSDNKGGVFTTLPCRIIISDTRTTKTAPAKAPVAVAVAVVAAAVAAAAAAITIRRWPTRRRCPHPLRRRPNRAQPFTSTARNRAIPMEIRWLFPGRTTALRSPSPRLRTSSCRSASIRSR